MYEDPFILIRYALFWGNTEKNKELNEFIVEHGDTELLYNKS